MVRERDASDGGENQNPIYVRADLEWRGDVSKSEHERQKQNRSDNANHAEAANWAESRRWSLDQRGVKCPTKGGRESDEQARQCDVSILTVGLKPNYTESAGQTEQCAELKLPLPNHFAFFRKKHECEHGAEDDRRSNENRVNTGTHVKQGDDLGDLMNDIRQTRN